MQPSQYGYSKSWYRFAVTSGSPRTKDTGYLSASSDLKNSFKSAIHVKHRKIREETIDAISYN